MEVFSHNFERAFKFFDGVSRTGHPDIANSKKDAFSLFCHHRVFLTAHRITDSLFCALPAHFPLSSRYFRSLGLLEIFAFSRLCSQYESGKPP